LWASPELRRGQETVELLAGLLTRSGQATDPLARRRNLIRIQEHWSEQVTSVLADQKLDPIGIPAVNSSGFMTWELSRERITRVQSLITRWLPQGTRILYAPFQSAFMGSLEAEIPRDRVVLAPYWLPLFPHDFSTVMSVFRAAVQLRLADIIRRADSRNFSFEFSLNGPLAEDFGRYLGRPAHRFSTRDIVTDLAAGAFALDCIALNGEIATFRTGLRQLVAADAKLTAYKEVLLPYIRVHEKEFAETGAIQEFDGEPYLWSETLNLAVTFRGLSAEQFTFLPGMFMTLMGSELESEMRVLTELETVFPPLDSPQGLLNSREALWRWLDDLGLDVHALRPWPEDCKRFIGAPAPPASR
jgi:hypothetical protein